MSSQVRSVGRGGGTSTEEVEVYGEGPQQMIRVIKQGHLGASYNHFLQMLK